MSPNITDHLAQDKIARITGGFYLGFILASVLADTLGHIGLGETQLPTHAPTVSAALRLSAKAGSPWRR